MKNEKDLFDNYNFCDSEKELLCIIGYKTDIVHCPMIRPLVVILRHYFTQGETFCLIDEITKKTIIDDGGYIPVSKKQYDYFLLTFDILLKKTSHKVYDYLHGFQEFSPSFYSRLFSELFFSFFPMTYILTILDSFFLEGYKVLYRYGIEILEVLYSDYSRSTTYDECLNRFYSRKIEFSYKEFKDISISAFKIRKLSSKNIYSIFKEQEDSYLEDKNVMDELLNMRILNHTPHV